MKKNKIIVDVLFIVLSALTLIVFVKYGILEKYLGFSLIPILIAYFLGQFVQKRFTKSSE